MYEYQVRYIVQPPKRHQRDLRSGQTTMRVDETFSSHELLPGTFQALDLQNKGLMSVPAMFFYLNIEYMIIFGKLTSLRECQLSCTLILDLSRLKVPFTLAIFAAISSAIFFF